jgi:hypothetical protein
MGRRKRDYIPYRERLAAALACLLPPMRRDELRRYKATADDVLSLFHFDHIELHALNGSDAWWNLDPKMVGPHREKSRQDTAIVAKVKRLSAEHEDFRRRVLSPIKRASKPKSKWPKRKLQSRGFPRRRK